MSTVEQFVLEGMGFTEAQMKLVQRIRELPFLKEVKIDQEETRGNNSGSSREAIIGLTSKIKKEYPLSNLKDSLGTNLSGYNLRFMNFPTQTKRTRPEGRYACANFSDERVVLYIYL